MSTRKSVLILSYYWPPSGGAGVQRWLKFCKYFAQLNVDTTVITVDPKKASYPVLDESLVNEVPEGVQIHYTDSTEPLQLYQRLFRKKSIPHSGFANENNPSMVKKTFRFIRGNFFLPDARKGWNRHALRKAEGLLAKNQYDAVIITSPPHSSQLIGLALKRKFDFHWIADIRDPWTDIYYYDKLLLTPLAKQKDLTYEKTVLNSADQVIVVSEDMRRLFSEKMNDASRITVIPNGFDQEDFNDLGQFSSTSTLQITYTGSMAANYPVDSLLKATEQVGKEHFSFDFVGTFSEDFKNQMRAFQTHFPGYVNHAQSIQYLNKSDVLLLIIPNIKNNGGILTGKLFEYLGSGKPILLIGPTNGDAAKVLAETRAGSSFDYSDSEGIKAYLQHMLEMKRNGTLQLNDRERVEAYSRFELAKQMIEKIP